MPNWGTFTLADFRADFVPAVEVVPVRALQLDLWGLVVLF